MKQDRGRGGTAAPVFLRSREHNEKTGALIVIERKTTLTDIIESGTIIDAESTPFLIRNIFFKNSPLHDGALVIRNGRLYAAGCLLPLSDSNKIARDLGTRHRAGIGVSEMSDAIAILVSEENGVISLAEGGNLRRYLDLYSLKKELTDLLLDKPKSLNVRQTLLRKIGKTEHPDGENRKNGKGGGEDGGK